LSPARGDEAGHAEKSFRDESILFSLSGERVERRCYGLPNWDPPIFANSKGLVFIQRCHLPEKSFLSKKQQKTKRKFLLIKHMACE